ncbi:4939_t:CDS:2 [Diversispora eburnea]|uniref:4939_t:CDS:1 n=1 Tax=Diversispora eburnea TaxID=1213867 RepID=A0A9N9CG57_9GLOM|nr:4939_t:CDS:2 [Diversispora eburnea]
MAEELQESNMRQKDFSGVLRELPNMPPIHPIFNEYLNDIQINPKLIVNKHYDLGYTVFQGDSPLEKEISAYNNIKNTQNNVVLKEKNEQIAKPKFELDKIIDSTSKMSKNAIQTYLDKESRPREATRESRAKGLFASNPVKHRYNLRDRTILQLKFDKRKDYDDDEYKFKYKDCDENESISERRYNARSNSSKYVSISEKKHGLRPKRLPKQLPKLNYVDRKNYDENEPIGDRIYEERKVHLRLHRAESLLEVAVARIKRLFYLVPPFTEKELSANYGPEKMNQQLREIYANYGYKNLIKDQTAGNSFDNPIVLDSDDDGDNETEEIRDESFEDENYRDEPEDSSIKEYVRELSFSKDEVIVIENGESSNVSNMSPSQGLSKKRLRFSDESNEGQGSQPDYIPLNSSGKRYKKRELPVFNRKGKKLKFLPTEKSGDNNKDSNLVKYDLKGNITELNLSLLKSYDFKPGYEYYESNLIDRNRVITLLTNMRTDLPPLPPIDDYYWEKLAIGFKDHRLHWEKLEWLGDRVLMVCVLRFANRRYFRETQLKLIRDISILMVTNKILAAYSLTLKLDQLNKMNFYIVRKIHADAFETYFGAYYLAYGEDATTNYLEKLMGPLFDILYYTDEDISKIKLAAAYFSMPMNNLTLLTRGNKIYSKKRKLKNSRPTEIVFDEDARREFLTGFHKRKLERKEKAKEAAIQKEKKARAESKKAIKDARKKEIEERLTAIQTAINKVHGIKEENDQESENKDDNNKDDNNNTESLKQYITPQTLTTVTVVEDFDVSEGKYDKDNYKSNDNDKDKGNDKDNDNREINKKRKLNNSNNNDDIVEDRTKNSMAFDSSLSYSVPSY